MIRLALFSVFLLTGCTQLPAEVFNHCEDPVIIDPPMPTPVTLVAPEFYVVSNENKDSFDVRIQRDSDGVFYAITPAGYTVLAQDMQELRRYIRELQQVVIYYKKYDERTPDTQ